jgi:hypothetical protein
MLFVAEGPGRAARSVALFATAESRVWLASLLLDVTRSGEMQFARFGKNAV